MSLRRFLASIDDAGGIPPLCVRGCFLHQGGSSRLRGQAETSIVWVAEGIETVLIRGQDFYASPRLSPDGQYLAFISWDHPNMPWNETQLKLARLNWAAGHPVIRDIAVLVGEDAACSVMEPV
ncbi:MAG: hypothetical protein AAYR33_09190 [Acetobacteraceae bacterium]